jgi:branched-chain amino acid transport system substrate-binding protein
MLLAGVPAALALALSLGGPFPAAAQKPPIRVGLLNVRTGPFTVPGETLDRGLRLALDEANWEAAGRKIELIAEDDANDPAMALTKVRKLVEKDRVHILVGPIGSSVALAMRDYMVEKGLPWIITQATVASLTREKRAPNIFRISFTDEQLHAPMGRYFHDKLGFKKLVVVAPDFVAGHTQSAAFEKSFTAAGGQVTQKILIPLGAPDPAPYIARINTQDVDGVHAILFGADALRFIKQAKEFGLMERTKLTAMGSAVEEGSMLLAYGDEVLGMLNYNNYAADFDGPATKRFVAAYRPKAGGRVPTQQAAMGYEGGRLIIEAAKLVNGNVEDVPGVLAAIRRVDFVGPRAPIRFDGCQNLNITVYVRKVVRVGGQLQHTVVDAVPGVTDPGCPVR